MNQVKLAQIIYENMFYQNKYQKYKTLLQQMTDQSDHL